MPPGGPPFPLHTGVGSCSVLGAPSSLSRVPFFIRGDPTLFPGVPLSARRVHGHTRRSPLPLHGVLALSSRVPPPFLKVPPSIPLIPLSARRVPSLFKALLFPRGLHSVLGSPCSFPGAPILYFQRSCSLSRGCVPPRAAPSSLPRGPTLYSRGSRCLPGGTPLPSRWCFLLPGSRCARGPRSPAGGQSAPFCCGSRSPPGRGSRVPPHRGAAAAARGGAGAGAGAHPRCRWRGGAAAPSAYINRAGAPVPQRGRGSP